MKELLEGIGCDVHASTASDLEKEEIMQRVVKGYRN